MVCVKMKKLLAALAPTVEQFHGKEKVAGSNPASGTISFTHTLQ